MPRAHRRVRRALVLLARALAVAAAAAVFAGAALFAVAFVALPSRAQAAQLVIEAPRFTFDRATNRYTYEDGSLTLGSLRLFASQMELDATTGLLRASGLVRLETASVTGIAESVEFDTRSEVGRLSRADLYTKTGLYLRAEEMLIHPDGSLEFRRCTLTTCPPGQPGWRIDSTTLTLGPGDVGVAWNPVFWLEGLPALYLPVIAWPTVAERRTGVLPPEIDRDDSTLGRFDLGWRLKVPVFVNLGYDHDVTLTPEVIQHRGLALEARYAYAFWPGQTGRLTLWGIREQDARVPGDENTSLLDVDGLGPMLSATDAPLTRYRVQAVHNQPLGTAGRLLASYQHVSDGQVYLEYDGVTGYRPYQTYQASLTGQWRWASAALTYEQNADYLEESVYADQERFTDLSLRPQLLPRVTARVGGRLAERVPLAAEVELSATHFEAARAVSGTLVTASPALALPLALGGAFELRPRLTQHLVRYSALQSYDAALGAQTPLADERFAQHERSVELRTVLARVYAGDEPGDSALKHRIVPRLIYTDIEDVAQPTLLANQVLRPRVAQQLLTLRVDTDLLRRAGSARAGDAATPDPAPGRPALPWDAPVPSPVREVLRASLVQRYNALLEPGAPALVGPAPSLTGETAAGEPLLPLLLELQVLGQGYALTSRLNHHHQLRRTTEAGLALSAQARPRTLLGFAYDFNEFAYATPDNRLVPAVNAFSFGGEVALHDTVSTGLSGRINLQDEPPPLDRRIDQASYFVDYHPACYTLRLSVTDQVVATVEGGNVRYYEDHLVKIVFTLGGLVGGSARSLIGTGQLGDAPMPGGGLPGPPYAAAAAPARCNG